MTAFALLGAVVHCYVGCNTGSPDKQALHVLECDTETGAAKVVQSVKGVQGTTYFSIDREGRNLYSTVSEPRAAAGRRRSSAVRFPIEDGRLGAMERLAELPCEASCHVRLSPDGRRCAFAAYSSATGGTFPLAGGGVKSFVFPDDAMGPDPLRQKKAYAHCAFYAPASAGLRLGVVDLGCDRIWFVDPETMRRDEPLTIGFDPGDGPRHALWSADGRFLFVINELGNSVTSFSFDGKSFARLGKWSTLPAKLTPEEAAAYPRLKGEISFSKASAIKLTADGKVLMASNRGYDSIAFFSVDGGHLRLRNIAKLDGSFPRDFELMPGERFMVVGYELSDAIRIFRFDRERFALTPVGAPIAAWHPLCFSFGPVPR